MAALCAGASGRAAAAADRDNAADLPRGRTGYARSCAHLLGRRDAEHLKAGGDDEGDRLDESEPRHGQILGASLDKAQARFVLALVPQAVEGGGDLLQIEGDAMRLMRLGRALDHARPLREEADQRDLV